MNQDKQRPDLAQDEVMQDFRASIDHFDTAFLNLLAERCRVAQKILQAKKLRDLDLGQGKLRKQDMTELLKLAVRLELKQDFFQDILTMAFEEAMERFKSGEEQTSSTMEEFYRSLEIDDLRDNLLNVETALCRVLAERFRAVRRIGAYKHKLKIKPLDETRWIKVLNDKVFQAQKLGLSEKLIIRLYNRIHEAALSIEAMVAKT